MRTRTRMIAAAAVTAAVAAGSTAAVASTTGGRPGAHAKTTTASATSAGAKAAGSKSAEEQQGHDAMVAEVARELHVSTARAAAALRPLFAAGRAEVPSPVFTAAARSLGVSPQQLNTALGHAKQALAAGG